jgi:hypothetical protein
MVIMLPADLFEDTINMNSPPEARKKVEAAAARWRAKVAANPELAELSLSKAAEAACVHEPAEFDAQFKPINEFGMTIVVGDDG